MVCKGSFRCSVSVKLGVTQEVDLLLQQWDTAWAALARAEARYEISRCQIRPKHRLGRRLCPGEFACRLLFIIGCLPFLPVMRQHVRDASACITEQYGACKLDTAIPA